MSRYKKSLQEEQNYLKKTITFIKRELLLIAEGLTKKKEKLIAERKDMWENTVHFTDDFTKLTEMNQYLNEVNNSTANYQNTLKRQEKYKRIIKSPYFGRFDFAEIGGSRESVYIGLANVMDQQSYKVYVYDWRAPISSIFYRYEIGKASYNAPLGVIDGEVVLKRQYSIKDSQLEYFFDCSFQITDEILQEILSRNSSAKMRNIVETIQKEQDQIIRDTDNELLIVQGVAGSGKTSIALHRIAYLIYHGLGFSLSSKNMIIISPNQVFSNYISRVLPELGEENVEQTTFDNIITRLIDCGYKAETREQQLEMLLNRHHCNESELKKQSNKFKGSRQFVQILERLLWHYAHHVVAFEDVYLNGKVIEKKEQLKNRFLNNKISLPMSVQLQRIEKMILEKAYPLRKEILAKLEKIVEKSEGHELEIESFSRLLLMKKSKIFTERLYRFTRINHLELYRFLFSKKEIFLSLAAKTELPPDFDKIFTRTRNNLKNEYLEYDDCAPLLYLKLRIEGCKHFNEVKHVVIDEAQDYSFLCFEVFKLFFKNANYTILGDVEQSLISDVDYSLYDSVSMILAKERRLKVELKKSYRSTYEINKFCQCLLGKGEVFIPFVRHGKEPIVSGQKTAKMLNKSVSGEIVKLNKEGYNSIAVICKSLQEAKEAYLQLREYVDITLIKSDHNKLENGSVILPLYTAKGLEFDAVIVYNANSDNFGTEEDKKLLYIACTRALHRLVLFYTGEKSPFLLDS